MTRVNALMALRCVRGTGVSPRRLRDDIALALHDDLVERAETGLGRNTEPEASAINFRLQLSPAPTYQLAIRWLSAR
jgi:hypothetical protein